MAEDINSKLADDFKKRSENFHKDYIIISQKYKVDIASVLTSSPNGILPKIVLIDLNKKETKNG